MVPALFLYAALVDNVRGLIAQHNFDAAERQARAAEAHGATPEVAEAFSWIARGELEAKHYEKADVYAAETRKLADALLRERHLDAEPVLPIALGASIEVHAQALAATGQRSEAVVFLRDQSKLFAGTSIVERIRKNLNLLSHGRQAGPGAGYERVAGREASFAWPACADIRCCCFSGPIGASIVRRSRSCCRCAEECMGRRVWW